MDRDEVDICYICLGDEGPLIRPCACRSLQCHQACLARWQLQSAGKQEEKQCRFCQQQLPSWKDAFSELSRQSENDQVAVMSIQFNGQKYWLEVRPGDGGVEQFKEDVRRLLGLLPDQAFDITFECKVPVPLAGDNKLELQGLQAYDAAVYCASLSAAQRKHKSTSQEDNFVWLSETSSSTSSEATSETDSDSHGLWDQQPHRARSRQGVSSSSLAVDAAGSSSRQSSSDNLEGVAAQISDRSSFRSRIQASISTRPCLLLRLLSAFKVLWHLSGEDILF